MSNWSLFDCASDAIVAINDQNCVLYANARACQVFCLSEVQIFKKSIFLDDLFAVGARPEIFAGQALDAISDFGQSREQTVSLRNGDREHFIINAKRECHSNGNNWILYLTPVGVEIRLVERFKKEAMLKENVLNQLREYKNNIELFGLFFLYIVFGFAPLASKYTVQTMPPLMSAAVRSLLAGALILVVQMLRGKARVSLTQLKYLSVSGLFSHCLPICAFAVSLTVMPSGVAAALLGSQPVLIAVWTLFMRRRMDPFLLGAITLGTLSILLLVLGRTEVVMDWRYVLPLLAASSFSIGKIFESSNISPDHVCYQLLIGGALSVGISLLFESLSTVHLNQFSEASKLGFMFGTIFVGILAYPMQAWINSKGSPLMASSSAFVQPILGTIVGVLIGGEQFEMIVFIAVFLLVGALVLLFKDRSLIKRMPSSIAQRPPNKFGNAA